MLDNKQGGNETQNQPNIIENNNIKTIYDFFKMNLKEIPYESLEYLGKRNPLGYEIRDYRSTLDYLECGIFDKIEIFRFENNYRTVFFKFGGLAMVNIDRLKELVNFFFLLNGVDDYGKGEFTDEDKMEFLSKSYSFGRWWSNENLNNETNLRIDKGPDLIILTISLED